jgi:hypothetical protein
MPAFFMADMRQQVLPQSKCRQALERFLLLQLVESPQ